MVKITSLGICTGLGIGYNTNINQLIAEYNAFNNPKYLQTRHQLPVAEVPISNNALAETFHITTPHISRTIYLGLLALKEALSYLPTQYLKGKKVAFINSTTSGIMSEVENNYHTFINEFPIEQRFSNIIDEIDATAVTYALADYFGIDGYITTISTACSSAANTILLGADLIEFENYDLVICGGTDALSKYALNGFYSLKNIDKNLSQPFDIKRNGINLGEGAAYLVLEPTRSSNKALAHYIGGANTNEAHHPSAPDLDGTGAYNTMLLALNNANVSASDIQYINTHGTATESNDIAEARAINHLFGTAQPWFNATKSYTGHTLAAAGAVEAILTIGMLQKGLIVPSLRLNHIIPDLGLNPALSMTPIENFKYAMSNSFGFGGSNVCLILGR